MRVFKRIHLVQILLVALALISCGKSNSGSDDEPHFLPDHPVSDACLSMCDRLNLCPAVIIPDCEDFCGLVYGETIGLDAACDAALMTQFNCREAATCVDIEAGTACDPEINAAFAACRDV